MPKLFAAGGGHGIQLDVNPDSADIICFTNSVYRNTILHSIEIELPTKRQIRIANATHFLGMKLVALEARGESDLFASHDFEDIINLIVHRREIVIDVAYNNAQTRSTIQNLLQTQMQNSSIYEATEAALSLSGNSFAIANLTTNRMRMIVSTQIA